MQIFGTHTILLLVCLILSAGCDTPPESADNSGNKEIKEARVSQAVEGNTPAEPDKSRDMATVDSETTQYKTEKTAAEMELNSDLQRIEEDKISKKPPVETNVQ